jgi:Binding-prot-dependent transport system membrane comp, N-term
LQKVHKGRNGSEHVRGVEGTSWFASSSPGCCAVCSPPFMTSVMTYLMFFGPPADPAVTQCGKGCDAERIEQMRQALGLDWRRVARPAVAAPAWW